MKIKRYITIACIAASIACAAPAPYPVLVDDQADTAPTLTLYRGNETVFQVTFSNGETACDLSETTPFFAVSSNNVSAAFVTGSVSVVEESIGIVNFTFRPDIILWDTGNYEYQCGAWLSNGNPHVFNRGILKVQGSPAGR